MTSKEQRAFFRIDTVLPCSYRIISKEDAAQNPLPEVIDNHYIEQYFMKNLAQLDQVINDSISRINEKSTVLSDALSAINSKLNFILQTLEESQLSRAIPLRVVNISGSGVAIEMTESISLEDKVDLLIKPLQHELPILVRCDVVNIKKKTNEKEGECHMVSLTYQNLSVEDRRKLIYFIQTKEVELTHKQREQHYP